MNNLFRCYINQLFNYKNDKKSHSRTIFNFLAVVTTELGHKIRSRPEKRVGGGGLGKFKSMNKDDQKTRKFRQVNSSDYSSKRKFTRWTTNMHAEATGWTVCFCQHNVSRTHVARITKATQQSYSNLNIVLWFYVFFFLLKKTNISCYE